MRYKLFFTFTLALVLISLLVVPFIVAAGNPTILPLGTAQSAIREAYRALFEHTGAGGRAHWAQEGFSGTGGFYLPGTIVAPEGIGGNDYDKLILSGPIAARPAYALDTGGSRIALFRSTVSNDYGNAGWELADVRETLDVYLWGALGYDILDEAALASADLSPYDILIIPSVRWGNEQDVLDAIDTTALDNIRNFVEAGGFLYAQSNGAIIAEEAGLLPAGTVDLGSFMVLDDGSDPNRGDLSVLDPNSPLTFSWLTTDLYILTDPIFNADPALTVVAEFTNISDFGVNLPAIMSGEVGDGRVVLVNGHPTAATRRDQVPLFFNAIMWASGHRAELFGDAVQTYNPDLDPHLLPAYDPGTEITVNLTFANLWDTALANVAITETVAAGFVVQAGSITPAPSVINNLGSGETEIIWYFSAVQPGEVPLSFIAETDDQVLGRGFITFATGQASYAFGACPGGGTGCLPLGGGPFPPPGSVLLPAGFEWDLVDHQPFRLESRMAARLQFDRDIEGDRQYYLPPEGINLDVALPIENKEDTLASQTTYTDVIPLIAPIVDIDNQEIILSDVNSETVWVRNEPFFYNETGGGYLPAAGYAAGDTITLADWTGWWAVFDVPGGTSIDPLSGATNIITIPPTYTNYITVTADNKLLLPVQVLTWDIGAWPGYHYEEPAVRYGVHSRELLSRTVIISGDYSLAPDEMVVDGAGGTIYTHLGDHPIFYNDQVSSGVVYVPQAPVPSMLSYQDIWSRTHTGTLRAAFYDLIGLRSCGCTPGSGLFEERHAAVNVTFGMRADLDADGQRDEEVLIYPSRLDQVDLEVMIKSRNMGTGIPSDQMVIDAGMFKGLGVNIGPRNGDWAASWSSSDIGTRLISVETTSGYDHLLFQHVVPESDTVSITLAGRIDRYAGLTTEGMIKLHDGARFTYRQQAAGPSRYEVYDTHVQGVVGEAPELDIVKQGVPVLISTYGDQLYYVLTLDDVTDPRLLRRNGRGDPFLQSYGFTDLAATTYVGGREERTVLHSILQPGDMTRIRVEVNNNSEADFTNVVVAPQPPAGISVSQSYTDNVPPPIFFDLPFLYLDTIPEAGRGVYYFDVYVDPGYSGPRGELVEIPINFSADGAPAYFEIPAARLGIEDAAGNVYHTYGPAQSLTLSDNFPDYVELTGAALVTNGDVTALSGAIDIDAREAIFNGFTETVTFTEEVTSGQVTFNLPGDVLDRLYDASGDHRLFVVVQADIQPPVTGPNQANEGAVVSYDDALGLNWEERSNELVVEVHGAAVQVEYTCEWGPGGPPPPPPSRIAQVGVDDPSNCLLEPYQSNEVYLEGTFYNAGDYPAQNLTATLALPPDVEILEVYPENATIDEDKITWQLGDLGPGGFVSVEALVSITPFNNNIINEDNVGGPPLLPRSIQRTNRFVVKAVNLSHGQFVDAFTDQLIEADLAGAYYLPVRGSSIGSVLFLPIISRNYNPNPDLVVTNFTVTPADLVAGQAAQVTVEVANIGNSAAGPFWVDFYISPNQVPATAGILWNNVCGVSPCDGIAWGVNGLGPKESITLTGSAGSYAAEYTRWTGAFRVTGIHDFYVYVDAWNGEGTTGAGAVSEADETNNQAAISGRQISGAATAHREGNFPLTPRALPGQ